MAKMVREVTPDYIFHLAALVFVPASWLAPQETFVTNVIGTINLFEAIRKENIDPKIQVAGSSEEYGLVYENELPITEENPLRPLNPYAVSKVAQDHLSHQYNKNYGMKIVVTRAFNHIGPKMGASFVTSNFAKQIAEIENNHKKPVIYVGNLAAKRDFTDVRDIVKAYYLSLQKCDFGEAYNICSEKTCSIQSILDMLLGMSKTKIEVKPDLSRLRANDVQVLLGDCSKFKKKTGWEPTIPINKTLSDLLNYWRDTV
jgi:GDP-4-dehydro-6-deoxy-D-mannose reductase